jgi:hypothetical protein
MTHPQRQLADRRQDALTAWRGLERRQAQRRALDSARVCHWIDRFHHARQSVLATDNEGGK